MPEACPNDGPEPCPCGSGLDVRQCCYARFPSLICPGDPAAETDFYTRWAINRNMLWRVILRQLRQLPRLRFTGAAQAPLSLIILGAGPCRDLPMDFLCATFDEVVLVDKDADSLAASVLYLPAGTEGKVVRIPWDVNGAFGGCVEGLLDGVRAGRSDIGQVAREAGRCVAGWTAEDLPGALTARLPFSFVISDLLMTQLSMCFAFQLSLALGTSLRDLYTTSKPELNSISLAAGRNHLGLLRLLAGPGQDSSIIVLNDTFMLGRDFDGSESLFNQVAAGRDGKDALDRSWITADDIDAWIPDYSLLGSDLALTLRQPGPPPGLKLLDRTWWWWPHCYMKSYLVVAYLVGVLACEL